MRCGIDHYKVPQSATSLHQDGEPSFWMQQEADFDFL
jgi:hypothetical protein